MIKGFLILTISLTAILAGCDKNCEVTCIDPSKIDPDKICTMEYAPVCGCNNVTYGNACIAEGSGVTRYTQGPCDEE